MQNVAALGLDPQPHLEAVSREIFILHYNNLGLVFIAPGNQTRGIKPRALCVC